MLLKGIFGPILRPFDAVVGGIDGHDRRTIPRSDRVLRSLQVSHDRGSIASRSRFNWSTIVEFIRESS